MNKKVDKILDLIEKGIKKNFKNSQYTEALHLIKTYASIMYLYNQTYANYEIEEILYKIINTIYEKPNIIKDELDNNTIVFYDGFGLESRGLIQIYLKALCKKYHVIYITDILSKSKIDTIEELVKMHNGELYYIDKKEINNGITELVSLIKYKKPKNMFLYTYPDDIIGVSVFELFENIIYRYQINLTDHAFWLGAKSFDYCIEFRDYGASITSKHRNIDENCILKLPFYPNINYSQEFIGYPCENNKMENKFIFSGGALYKTFGENQKYYKIVEELLLKYPDLYFWYAGSSGDDSEIKKLVKKYPKRVFYTEERKDLYQILQRCFFYLSTYPICGGLMFQYAARAKKLPITLKHDDITDEFLLNQEKLKVIFDEEDDMFLEIDKIHSDNKYKQEREAEISNSVISEAEFENNLYQLIEEHRTKYDIEYKSIDVERFKKIYKDNIKDSDIYKLFFEKNSLKLLQQFPLMTLRGLIIKIICKIKK